MILRNFLYNFFWHTYIMTEVLNNTSNNNFVTPPSSPPKLGTTYSIFEEPLMKNYIVFGEFQLL